MAVVVWAAINTDQEDRDMDPGEAKEVKFELVHIGGLTIE
jgi:hypothetical protein